MNGIFFIIVLSSIAVLTFISPDKALASMLNGGEKAVELSVTMLAVYSVWLGLLKIAEQCGLTSAIARALKKPVQLLFGKVGDKACEHISMNLSANLLGMGGIATPMGVCAARELDLEDNYFASCMLFVLAATSIQLLPTSVIALRSEAGSTSPGDIIIPTLIATIFSTTLAAVGLHLVCRRKKR